METNELVHGSKWVHGNTYRPSVDTVIGVFAWGNLTEKQQRDARTLAYGPEAKAALELALYVVYRTAHQVGGVCATNLDVYKATRYPSNEAMIAAYQAKRAPLQGLPGGRL